MFICTVNSHSLWLLLYFVLLCDNMIDKQTEKYGGKYMERLAAFEQMLADIQAQSEYEKEQMEKLKSQGKEKSATYRQYFGNRMLYKMLLEKYQQYGLID